MHAHGIRIGADLARLSMDEMVERFGSSAQYWFNLARGIDERPVNPDRERKSVGAEDTFQSDISMFEEARALMAPLMDKVWTACQKRELQGRTVTIKMKFSDFEQITRSRSASKAFASKQEMRLVVDDLLEKEFPPRLPVRLLGVTLSNFSAPDFAGDGQIELAL